MKKYIPLLLLLLLANIISSLTISIKDNNNTAIPYVIIQSTSHSTVSDSTGIASIIPNQSEYTFSRIGFHTATKSYTELLQNPIVILKQAPIEADDFIVKASTPTSPSRTTTASQKIYVDNNNFTNINDVINDIQNINTLGIRLPGERQTISLGGHQSRHTIIKLDNIVLNPSGQAVDLSTIPFSQIDYIEVVKNNVSTETGSGGIAGMIIIHTKKNNRQNQIYLSSSVGSFDSYMQNIGFQAFYNNFGLLVNTSMINSKNDFTYSYRDSTYTRDNNRKKQFNLSTDLQYQYKNHDIKYSFRLQNFNNQLPGPINQLNMFLNAYQYGNTIHQNLIYLTNINEINIETQAYRIDTESTYDNTQTPIIILRRLDETKQNIQGASIAAKKNIFYGDFNIATEYKNEKYAVAANSVRHRTNGVSPSVRQTTPSPTLYTFSLLSSKTLTKNFNFYTPVLTASYRFDHNNTFSTQNSYRIEFNHHFYTYIPFQINSSFGTSYMIPSFFELYYQGDSQTQGNPDLLPEKSNGYRIETTINTNPSLTLAYWKSYANNLIYWNRTNLGWKPFNMQSAEITNYEIMTQYTFFKSHNIQFAYTNTDARNRTDELNNKFIPWTPAYYYDIALNLKFGDLTQNINFNAQGEQWTTRDQLISPLKGYEIWGTKTNYNFILQNINCNVNLIINNIFNKKYQNYPNLPEPGRSWEINIVGNVFIRSVPN